MALSVWTLAALASDCEAPGETDKAACAQSPSCVGDSDDLAKQGDASAQTAAATGAKSSASGSAQNDAGSLGGLATAAGNAHGEAAAHYTDAANHVKSGCGDQHCQSVQKQWKDYYTCEASMQTAAQANMSSVTGGAYTQQGALTGTTANPTSANDVVNSDFQAMENPTAPAQLIADSPLAAADPAKPISTSDTFNNDFNANFNPTGSAQADPSALATSASPASATPAAAAPITDPLNPQSWGPGQANYDPLHADEMGFASTADSACKSNPDACMGAAGVAAGAAGFVDGPVGKLAGAAGLALSGAPLLSQETNTALASYAPGGANFDPINFQEGAAGSILSTTCSQDPTTCAGVGLGAGALISGPVGWVMGGAGVLVSAIPIFH